jgi:hypothetical protein
MKVLIADDSKALRELVADVVVSIGCEVVGEASDGVAAIVAAIQLNPTSSSWTGECRTWTVWPRPLRSGHAGQPFR